MHNVVVEEPQHQHPLPDCFVVSATVLFELPRLQVECDTVQLDYEKSFKEKVDSSYARNPNLGLGADAHVTEQDPCEGFYERTRTPVHLGQHIPGLPAPIPHKMAAQVIKGDVAANVGTFDHHERFQRGKAEKCMQKNVRQCNQWFAPPRLGQGRAVADAPSCTPAITLPVVGLSGFVQQPEVIAVRS